MLRVAYSVICYCALNEFTRLRVDTNVSRAIYEAIVDLGLREVGNGRRSSVCLNGLRSRHLGDFEGSDGSVWG